MGWITANAATSQGKNADKYFINLSLYDIKKRLFCMSLFIIRG